MTLEKINLDFSVCKLNKDFNIKDVDFTRQFVFLSKTDEEVSLVCESSHIPKDAEKVENGWKAFRIAGTLDFGMIGVIANLSSILAKADISVFVVSTYDTDYIFVKDYNYEKAQAALEDALCQILQI